MGGKFAVVVWGGVEEPANIVTVDVEGEGAGVGAIVGVVSGDGGFGELSSGEIGDFDFEVKWCWGPKEFCPCGYCCILEVGVMKAEELLKRYAAGERDFSGVDLREIDLSRVNLPGINLSQADLIGADLRGSDLSDANLTVANLAGARLRQTRFDRADLSGANLQCAVLEGAIMESANLSRADLTDANLAGARLMKADLFGARINYANLTQTNLKDARGFDFVHCEDGCIIVDRTIMPNGEIEQEYRLI